MKSDVIITLIVGLCFVAAIALMSQCSVKVARSEASALCHKQGGAWEAFGNRCTGAKP